jgi:protein phosphatase
MTEPARAIASRELDIPELSLVLLVGASGSGKSTFAAQRFLATEVLSSDSCRALVADDENDQSATGDAFEILHVIAGKRMSRGRLTVIDATNVKREDRANPVHLAREHHFLPVAIAFDLPERVCQERNRHRPDRAFGPHVVRNQIRDLRRGMRGLRKEGFHQVHVLDSPEAIAATTVRRTRLWNNRTDDHGPLDIIGDVHGCCNELERLLAELDYRIIERRDGEFPDGGPVYAHPESRTAVFVGDLADRGPRILDTVRLVRKHGGGRVRPLRPGQSRHQARPQAPRPRRPDHARTRPIARRDRRPR